MLTPFLLNVIKCLVYIFRKDYDLFFFAALEFELRASHTCETGAVPLEPGHRPGL
jgi:hypothetical protein